MKDRETLDEAIDRVASRMSAGESWQGVDLPALPPRGFIAGLGAWRWAVVAAGAIFLATALVVFGPDRRQTEVVVETSRVTPSGAGDLDRPDQPPPRLRRSAEAFAKAEGRPLRRGEDAPVAARRARASRVPEESPDVADWGLEAIEAPVILDVAPVSVPALDVAETERIDPLVILDLVIDASSESPFPRE